MKRFSFTILFFVSYIPLFIILFIQHFHAFTAEGLIKPWKLMISDNIIPTACLVISLLALCLYKVLLGFIQRYGYNAPVTVSRVKNTGVEYLSYLGTYIIPFIGAKFDNLSSSIATIVLILLICLIYPKTNLIYANPTLALFGFHIYKVTLETDSDEEVVVISKQKMKKKTAYRLRELTDDVFFAKTTAK